MKLVAPTTLRGRVVRQLSRQKYLFIVGLLVGILGMFIYYTPIYLSKVSPNLVTHQYLVAARDIAAGDRIADEDLAAVEFVQDYTPSHAIEAERKPEIAGRFATAILVRGDIITPASFADSPAEGGGRVARIVPPNKKAYYLKPADFATSPLGLSEGDHIDLIAASSASSSAVLQEAPVIAIHYNEQKDEMVVGLALSDNEIMNVTRALADKAFMEIVILPKRNEQKALVK